MSALTGRQAEAGYSLVALLASVTIMLVLMGAGSSTWRYIMKNDREQELIFRGGEIADAIARYQKKNGNALPTSLEVLVKGKFLRRAYKDPMTKDGKWRFVRQGETVAGGLVPGAPAGGPGGPTTTTTTSTRPTGPSGPGGGSTIGGTLGTLAGVASTSTDKSLRVFNGRTKYSEWLFLPGQPRVVGRQTATPTVIGPGQSPSPAVPPRSR